jgi:hypothetical protein
MQGGFLSATSYLKHQPDHTQLDPKAAFDLAFDLTRVMLSFGTSKSFRPPFDIEVPKNVRRNTRMRRAEHCDFLCEIPHACVFGDARR